MWSAVGGLYDPEFLENNTGSRVTIVQDICATAKVVNNDRRKSQRNGGDACMKKNGKLSNTNIRLNLCDGTGQAGILNPCEFGQEI